jgi:hypothetical protein
MAPRKPNNTLFLEIVLLQRNDKVGSKMLQDKFIYNHRTEEREKNRMQAI